MAHRVYHWKHGWIPLDHVAAGEKAPPGLHPVSQDSLPRASHIVASFDGHQNVFAVHDTKTGGTMTLTQDQAVGHPRITSISSSVQVGDRVVLGKSGSAAWEVVRVESDGSLTVRSLGGRSNTPGTKPTKTVSPDQVRRHGRPSGETNAWGAVYNWTDHKK